MANRCTARFLALLAAASGLGCASPVAAPPGAPLEPAPCAAPGRATHTAFLIGDGGAPRLPAADASELVDPVLRALHRDVGRAAERLGEEAVVVIFLGDNVYGNGLAPADRRDRRRGERILEAQIAAAAPARAVFTLGNHDWDAGGSEAWERALGQRRFLEGFGPRVGSLPPAGCAGPSRLDLGPYLRFVFIDPLGLRHLAEHPEEHFTECPRRDTGESLLALAAELARPGGRHLAVAQHHPLLTAGPHGGHFGWQQHLFPLTDLWSRAWLPLPGIGSLYAVARQLGVSDTDATSRRYREMVVWSRRAARPRVPLVYAAGHDHGLQVHRDVFGAYYLVSGAGSSRKISRVEPMDTLMLAEAQPGYMRLDVFAGGALEVSVTTLAGEAATPIFRHCLAEGPPPA